jgi:hypothetical protein
MRSVSFQADVDASAVRDEEFSTWVLQLSLICQFLAAGFGVGTARLHEVRAGTPVEFLLNCLQDAGRLLGNSGRYNGNCEKKHRRTTGNSFEDWQSCLLQAHPISEPDDVVARSSARRGSS